MRTKEADGALDDRCPAHSEVFKVDYFVHRDGRVEERRRESTGVVIICHVGRRPQGHEEMERGSTAEEYLRRMADLEAAAAHAFEDVAHELRVHGAPDGMVRAALRSAADERRHARQVAAMVGGSSTRHDAAHRPKPPRRVAAMALENAVEGCVRETWGAMSAHVQAATAIDPRFRRCIAAIASDETRHAALSWRLHRWMWPQLDDAARHDVRVAMRGARDALWADLGAPLPAWAPRMGLPTPRVARMLMRRLDALLWSADCGVALDGPAQAWRPTA